MYADTFWLQFGHLWRPQQFAVPETFDASRHDAGSSSRCVANLAVWNTPKIFSSDAHERACSSHPRLG